MSNSVVYPPEFASSEAELETVTTTTDNQENEDDQLKASKVKKIHSECSRIFDSIKQLYGEFFKKFLHDFCKANKKWSWYEEKSVEMDKEFACQLLSLDINRSSFDGQGNLNKLKNLFAWSNTRRTKAKQSSKTLNEKSNQFKNFIDNNKMEETYVLLLIFFVSNGYNICKQHNLFSNSTNDCQVSGSNSNSNNSERKPMLYSTKEQKDTEAEKEKEKETEEEIKVKFFSDLVKWTLEQKVKKGGATRIFQKTKGMKKSNVYNKLEKLFLNSDTQENTKDINFIERFFENEGGLFKLIEVYKSNNSASHDRLKGTYEAYLALYNDEHVHRNENIFLQKLNKNNNINSINNMNNRNHYSSDNGNNTINSNNNNMGSSRHIGRYGNIGGNIGSNSNNGGNGYVNDIHMSMVSGSDIGSDMNTMNRMSMNSMNTKRMGKTSREQFTPVSSRQCPHAKRRKQSIGSERGHNNNNNNNKNNSVNQFRKVRVFNRINNDRYGKECKGKIHFFEDGSIKLIEMYCSKEDFFDFSDFSNCTSSNSLYNSGNNGTSRSDSSTGFATQKQENSKQNETKIQTRFGNLPELPNLPHLTDVSFGPQVRPQVHSQNLYTLPRTGMTPMTSMSTPTALKEVPPLTTIPLTTETTAATTAITTPRATAGVSRHRRVGKHLVEMDGRMLLSGHSSDGATTNGNTMSSHSINSVGSFSGNFTMENMNENLSSINNLNNFNNMKNINSSNTIGMAENGLPICGILNPNGGNKSSFGNGINDGSNVDFSSDPQLAITSFNNGDLMSRNQAQVSPKRIIQDLEVPRLQPVRNLMFPQSQVESNSTLNRMTGVVNQVKPPQPPMNSKMVNSNSNSNSNSNEMKNWNINNLNNMNDHIHSVKYGNVNILNDARLRNNLAMVDFCGPMGSLSDSGAGSMISNHGMNGNSNVTGRCNLNGNVNSDNSRRYLNLTSGVNNGSMFNKINPIGESGNSNVNIPSNASNDCLINHNGRNNNGMNNNSSMNPNVFGFGRY